MKNAREITPIQAIELGEKLIEILLKGFENIGFRKKANARIQVLEELAVLQDKRIKSLEEKLM